ncbi:hypothetical protein GCM10009639_52130 [Kitasatospora putterlickiae]|uniref:Uncharacterized protein n=1 Tax=Kitasatospora putterlickiae TaxID=221725 RepID=A0ABN1YD77_9ACTN
MTDVTIRYRPLDAGEPAALLETPERVIIAIDPADPEAGLRALTALVQERFDSGAWKRNQEPPASAG